MCRISRQYHFWFLRYSQFVVSRATIVQRFNNIPLPEPELWTTIGFYCQLPIVYMWWCHNVMTYEKIIFCQKLCNKNLCTLEKFCGKTISGSEVIKKFSFGASVYKIYLGIFVKNFRSIPVMVDDVSTFYDTWLT